MKKDWEQPGVILWIICTDVTRFTMSPNYEVSLNVNTDESFVLFIIDLPKPSHKPQSPEWEPHRIYSGMAPL